MRQWPLFLLSNMSYPFCQMLFILLFIQALGFTILVYPCQIYPFPPYNNLTNAKLQCTTFVMPFHRVLFYVLFIVCFFSLTCKAPSLLSLIRQPVLRAVIPLVKGSFSCSMSSSWSGSTGSVSFLQTGHKPDRKSFHVWGFVLVRLYFIYWTHLCNLYQSIVFRDVRTRQFCIVSYSYT